MQRVPPVVEEALLMYVKESSIYTKEISHKSCTV
jgi:hypothetical protein